MDIVLVNTRAGERSTASDDYNPFRLRRPAARGTHYLTERGVAA